MSLLDDIFARMQVARVTPTAAGNVPAMGTSPGVLTTDGTDASWRLLPPTYLVPPSTPGFLGYVGGAVAWQSSLAYSFLTPLTAGDAGKALIVAADGTWTATRGGAASVYCPFASPVLSSEFSYDTSTGEITQNSVATAGSVLLRMQGVVGKSVSQVKVKVKPVTHSGMPATLPKVRFECRDMTGTTPGSWTLVDGFSEKTDSSLNYTLYGVMHTITSNSSYTGVGSPILTGYEYRLAIYGETGTSSLVGLQVLGTELVLL